jgi:uncharacterized Zn finger protein (UPF0148 family)
MLLAPTTPPMPAHPPSTRSLCFHCGRDCSSPPRFRDKAGRLWCAACVEKVTKAPVPITLAPPDHSGRHRAPCPKCNTPLAVGQPACPSCGYDPSSVPLEPSKARAILGDFDPDATPLHERLKTKARARRNKPPPPEYRPTCTQCGYDLRGVKPGPGDLTCPECGTANSFRIRSEEDERLSLEIARREIHRPVRYLIVGLLLTAALLLADGWIQGGFKGSLYGFIGKGPPGGWIGSLKNLGLGLAGYAGAASLAFTVSLACAFLWTGLNTTIRILALQVAGFAAAATALLLLLLAIPAPIPVWVLVLIAACMYAYLLADGQDLYFQDAAFVTGITLVLIYIPLVLGLI